MRTTISALLACICSIAVSGCFYDKASELYPPQTCDTSTVSWSKTILPIMQQQCAYAGCHAGSSPAGGIGLNTYISVQMQATNGALLGTVEHRTGYQPMPLGNNKLPDCQIAKLRIWIAAGSPEN